ncbi:MAG: YkgJ family cysteine cluster protein [Betaproteobacteria bacterium]|nr:YkgJ family cysteine cluster protein [Betaproteobacteria bacterium]
MSDPSAPSSTTAAAKAAAKSSRTAVAKPVAASAAKPPLYDCTRCPGYCCTYPRIIIDDEDLERIARHAKVNPEEARRRFTRTYRDGDTEEMVLRHKTDTIYASVCRFFDTTKRRCTIYTARPEVCRDYPHGRRCGYYEFLRFERRQQGNPEFVPSA